MLSMAFSGNACVLECPPRGGGNIGSTYTIHLRLTGKRIVDFLVVLIEHFPLAVTAEVLRANIE